MWLAGVPRPPCPFAMTADECLFSLPRTPTWVCSSLSRWTVPRHVIDVRVEFMRIATGSRPYGLSTAATPISRRRRKLRPRKGGARNPAAFRFRGSRATTGSPSSRMKPKATFAISPCARGMSSPTPRSRADCFTVEATSTLPPKRFVTYGTKRNSRIRGRSTKPCSAASTCRPWRGLNTPGSRSICRSIDAFDECRRAPFCVH